MNDDREVSGWSPGEFRTRGLGAAMDDAIAASLTLPWVHEALRRRRVTDAKETWPASSTSCSNKPRRRARRPTCSNAARSRCRSSTKELREWLAENRERRGNVLSLRTAMLVARHAFDDRFVLAV